MSIEPQAKSRVLCSGIVIEPLTKIYKERMNTNKGVSHLQINESYRVVFCIIDTYRFSRNRDDQIVYKSLLKKIGVLVYSVTEQTDPETPHGFLLEGIMEVISEFYNINLKNEVFKGMTENAKRRFHNSGRAPYGYWLSRVTE